MSEVQKLTDAIKVFVQARGWGKYHNEKDLALSLALEAAEVLEHFQWKNGDELQAYLRTHAEDLADEVADVLIYLLQLCDKLGIDIIKAAHRKMEKNGKKYPAEQVYGSSKKYTEY